MQPVQGPLRLIGAFLLPILLGRLLESALASRRAQQRLAERGDIELLTEEGRHLASKYVKSGAGLVAGGLAIVPDRIEQVVAASRGERRVGLRFWVQNLADLLLGLGAALRVLAEFLGEKRKLRRDQLAALSGESGRAES